MSRRQLGIHSSATTKLTGLTCEATSTPFSLQWRHNKRDGVSNHSISIAYSTVCSCTDQRKHQSSASLAFVMGIHRWPMISPHRGPVTRVGNSHRSASPRPTTLEEDRELFFPSILCLWFKIQGMRTYNFFDWISNTASNAENVSILWCHSVTINKYHSREVGGRQTVCLVDVWAFVLSQRLRFMHGLCLQGHWPIQHGPQEERSGGDHQQCDVHTKSGETCRFWCGLCSAHGSAAVPGFWCGTLQGSHGRTNERYFYVG